MSLADKIAAVARAEQACVDQRAAAAASLDHLKAELRRGATPVRIVVSGFALGVASGFSAPAVGAAGAAGGRLVSGPLYSMLLETVVPGLLAGLTAAASAAGEDQDDPDAEATEDETPDDDAADDSADGRRARDA
ncbi:MAG TPA: hypothetical protein VFQ84_03045 [Arenimonas sp.]|uniref:hypothetical protein n=1 Tax=Arenimonas sp. TaxID=1872635 RepID=UPI002D80D9C1|nr:hypothetical protein [Arenimonas sp.]HEU0152305.1 hypothetical protein [Arenimonas sp.]